MKTQYYTATSIDGCLVDEDNSLDWFFQFGAIEEIEIERTGSYTPGPRHVVSRLTERQREVLDTAIDFSYYQEPREATHDEIATATKLSETIVGEHLRKIKAAVFSSLHVGTADQ